MIRGEVAEAEESWSVGEREERLARARLAFDEELREASQVSARAARRVLVPVLWGAAILGGGLLVMLAARLVRRRQPPAISLLRVNVERPSLPAAALEKPLLPSGVLPAVGGAVARFALQRVLAQLSEQAERAGAFPAPSAGAAAERSRVARPAQPGNGRA